MVQWILLGAKRDQAALGVSGLIGDRTCDLWRHGQGSSPSRGVVGRYCTPVPPRRHGVGDTVLPCMVGSGPVREVDARARNGAVCRERDGRYARRLRGRSDRKGCGGGAHQTVVGSGRGRCVVGIGRRVRSHRGDDCASGYARARGGGRCGGPDRRAGSRDGVGGRRRPCLWQGTRAPSGDICGVGLGRRAGKRDVAEREHVLELQSPAGRPLC